MSATAWSPIVLVLLTTVQFDLLFETVVGELGKQAVCVMDLLGHRRIALLPIVKTTRILGCRKARNKIVSRHFYLFTTFKLLFIYFFHSTLLLLFLHGNFR